jgi:hypothetical protein
MNDSKVKVNSEITAYAHQVIEEFAAYMSESTKIEIMEQSPVKVVKKLKKLEVLDEDFALPKYCYSISMQDEGSQIKEFGFGSNPYDALKDVKEKLIKALVNIQGSSMTNSDRLNVINDIASGGSTLH